MVDAQKVKVMTKLAAFEQKESKRALKIVKYYRRDYIRKELLKTFLCVTIGYVLLLSFFALHGIEELLGNAVQMDFTSLAHKVTAGYVILLLVYLAVGVYVYNVRYSKAKRKVKEYDRMLHLLRQLYRREQAK